MATHQKMPQPPEDDSRLLEVATSSRVIQWLLCCYMRVLFCTYRLVVNDTTGAALPLNKSVGLYYIWHEHVVAGLFFLQRQGVYGHLVCDQTPEGQLANYCARLFGLVPLESNGKPSFVRRALEALEMNRRLYLVGDGSKGPAYVLQREIPYLCARSNVPLLFVECTATSALSFWRRWDRLKIPLPFSTITVTIHAPQEYEFDEQNEVRKKETPRENAHS